MDSNADIDKFKSESGRVPSPSSVSSAHSIRPLEWDSGADIGYECKLQLGLSTVERIALVSGTVNLLENCAPRNNTEELYSQKHNLGDPLAQSSPFIVSNEPSSENSIFTHGNIKCIKPLVDYSISSEYSFEDKNTVNESRSKSNGKFYDQIQNKSSKLSSAESSKSLDDIINHRQRVGQSLCRSRSSHETFLNLQKNSSEKNSSSSVGTIIPHIEKKPTKVSQNTCEYTNKSIPENNMSLGLCTMEQVGKKTTSSLEFFKKMYSDDANANAIENNTFSVRSGKLQQHSIQQKSAFSDGSYSIESLDGCSFEYVPGSVYNNNHRTSSTTSRESSSLNTFCSEVVEGVELITKYVENLHVSNKRQIIEKVAKSLISNLSDIVKSRESVTSRAHSKLLLDSSPELNSKTPPYKHLNATPSSESDFRLRNIDNNSESNPSSYIISSSSTNESRMPLSTSTACRSSRASNEVSVSLNSANNRCIRNKQNLIQSSESMDSSSNYKTSRNSCMKKCNSNKLNRRSNCLKEYLAKERDAQLLWIKSGIDHLNNLKKLYESQKQLRNDLNSLKRTNSIKTGGTVPLRTARGSHSTWGVSDVSARSVDNLSAKRSTTELKENTSCSSYAAQSSDNTPIDDRNIDLCRSISTERQARRIRKCDIVREMSVTYCKCSCTCKYCKRKFNKLTENKENVLSNSGSVDYDEKLAQMNRKPISKGSSKSPISYTVLFDKGPTILDSRNFQYTSKKSMNKVIRTPKRKIHKRISVAEVNNPNQLISLQEYLLRNNPDYVNRAEFRRQCLAEIAKLRELRDKSREELLSVIKNLDTSVNDTLKNNIPPPPLSVLRIFTDRSMKRQTEKKYKQLPEVQNKKLELKRLESYRRNQIMAKIFTKKLQKKVLKGQVNLANNVNVISA